MLVVVLLPRRHHAHETFSNEPAQVAEKHVALSPADRKRIGTTVDRFLIAALDRSDPATAWRLAGPDLRGSAALADWTSGSMPVPVYRARGTHFPGWTQLSVTPGHVSFDLIVQPRAGSKEGAMALNVQVIRRGSSWAVNRLYPVATFTPVGQRPRVVGPNDFGALGGGEATDESGRLGAGWMAVPVGLFGLGLAVVAVVLGRNWWRYRRARRAISSASVMPTLPTRRDRA